jgi:hypothetical protein
MQHPTQVGTRLKEHTIVEKLFKYVACHRPPSSSSIDPPQERLGHIWRAPHHGSRVEEGELTTQV